MTLAMALVFFACWIVWGVQEVGPLGFVKELFAPKGESTGPLKMLLIVVFFAAGCLEVISILFRPISLSFRLYGNIFAGETMLETMARVPSIGWLVQIPFYFMELLVGLVQALVFTLLTAVFTLLICQHHEDGICRRARLKEGARRHIWAICTSASRRSAPPWPSGAIGMKASEAVGRNPGAVDAGDGPVDSGHRVCGSDRVLHAVPREVRRV